jgi:hypothetical protein
MKKTTKRRLFITLSLAFTGVLCLSATATHAQDFEDSPFKFVVVLQGISSGDVSTTATTPFAMQNVGILSIGNQTLSATVDVNTDNSGLWWMGLISLGTIAEQLWSMVDGPY